MRFKIASLAVGVIVLLSCADHTAPTQIPDAPLFNFANGPDEPGLVVVRYDGIPQGLNFNASGMRVFHGVDPREIYCPPPGQYNDLWDFQYVYHPDADAWRMMLMLGSDLMTSVWPWDLSSCEDYLSTEPLAEGTSHFERIDRWPGESNAARVRIWQAQGQLVWADGEPAHYNGYAKYVITQSGELNWIHKINLR